jgi:hypothetical protein
LLRLFQRFALDRVKYSPKTGQPNWGVLRLGHKAAE